MTARELESLLSQHGFHRVSQKGSHCKWRNPETGKQAIVPEHKGKTLPVGTLLNILQNAEIPESQWRH